MFCLNFLRSYVVQIVRNIGKLSLRSVRVIEAREVLAVPNFRSKPLNTCRQLLYFQLKRWKEISNPVLRIRRSLYVSCVASGFTVNGTWRIIIAPTPERDPLFVISVARVLGTVLITENTSNSRIWSRDLGRLIAVMKFIGRFIRDMGLTIKILKKEF